MTWALPTVGGLLVVLAFVDVFLTVFHPTARAGPVFRLQSRTTWKVVRRLGGCGGRPRGRILSLGAPFIAVLTPLAWVVLLIVGFALVHYPFVLSFLFEPGTAGSRWLEALYYSGYVGLTLGLGDVIPTGAVFRILAIVEAAAGFAVLSMGLTYVLSVYRQQSTATALASTIRHALAPDGPMWEDPPEDVRRSAASLATTVASQLARVNAANRQYPVLHYFRHPSGEDALPPQLSRVLQWVQAMERSPESDSLFRRYSPFLTLRNALEEFLAEIEHQFIPSARRERSVGQDGDWRVRTLDGLLDYLCYPRDPQG